MTFFIHLYKYLTTFCNVILIDFICHYRTKSLLGDPEKPLLERKKLLRYQFNFVIIMNYRINVLYIYIYILILNSY